jgi:hypothetical protein
MVNVDVILRPYEDRRDIRPLHDMCWYSSWSMAVKDRWCLHFLERVLRKYGYIHIIPRSPTMIRALESENVVAAFQDFMVHVLDQVRRGRQITTRKQWRYVEGYIRWFYDVSQPIMSYPACVAEYTTLVPPYEEVIVRQQWPIQLPDPLQIIANIRAIVD